MSKLSLSRNILENVAILYFFFALTLISLLYFAGIGDINTTIVFVFSGFITSFFSKNMVVIFIVMLVVGHIYKYGTQQFVSTREGMQNKVGVVKYKANQIKNNIANKFKKGPYEGVRGITHLLDKINSQTPINSMIPKQIKKNITDFADKLKSKSISDNEVNELKKILDNKNIDIRKL